MSTKLSVNINKIALLRNARGGMVPDLIKFAEDCATFGADGITVHPRQDERHITRRDVRELSKIFPNSNCEFNIEGYPSLDFIKLVLDAKPSQVTLVPDSINQLTSDHGWDVKANFNLLKEVLYEFHLAGIRSSLFIEADPMQLENAKRVGADRIEFYTGPYAEDYQVALKQGKDLSKTVEKFKSVLALVEELGLGINAGHDLNLDNLKFLKSSIPNLLEVSIGQALVRDCLYYGLENTIQMYKRELN